MHILVLLSSWNGAKYLREQLESILAQAIKGSLQVLIRDDGSTDGTVSIVKEFDDPRIHLICGSNLGAKASFMALISEAMSYEADYIALADQDDVWLPNKLQRAVDKLHNATSPALYCSALNLVDEELLPLSYHEFVGQIGFESSFLVNCATGCTCVFNRQLLSLLSMKPDTHVILMHDWWLYLVANNFGSVIYDKESFILYRQHGKNQVGLHPGLRGIVRRLKGFKARSATPSRFTQACEFQRLYGKSMDAQKKSYLAHLMKSEKSFLRRLIFSMIYYPKDRIFVEKLVFWGTFLLKR